MIYISLIIIGISYHISLGRIYMTVQATAFYFMIRVVGTSEGAPEVLDPFGLFTRVVHPRGTSVLP